MEEETNPLPIHDKIYALLQERTSKRILLSEFFALVENIRITTECLENIRKELHDAYLIESKVNKITKSLIFYIRYSRAESRELLNQLIEMKWVTRKNYIIHIKKKDTK